MNQEKVICPYCNKEAPWVENKIKYGKNYGKSYMCYYCKDCDSYVGCHNNSRKPLGVLANSELRHWRMKVHSHIDPVWQTGKLHRKQVYAVISKAIGKQYHTAEADVETCKKILTLDIESLWHSTAKKFK